jgi:hypothetical protein
LEKRHQNIISGLVSELVINIFEFIRSIIAREKKPRRYGPSGYARISRSSIRLTTIINPVRVIMYRHGLDFFHRGLKPACGSQPDHGAKRDVAADERDGSMNNTQGEPVKNLQFERNSLRPVNLKQGRYPPHMSQNNALALKNLTCVQAKGSEQQNKNIHRKKNSLGFRNKEQAIHDNQTGNGYLGKGQAGILHSFIKAAAKNDIQNNHQNRRDTPTPYELFKLHQAAGVRQIRKRHVQKIDNIEMKKRFNTQRLLGSLLGGYEGKFSP